MCPLPVIVANYLRPPGANRSVTFRSRGFSPPQRFAPLSVCGSIAPRCQPGVRYVSPYSLPNTFRKKTWALSSVPRNALSYPSKNSPRQQPVRVTTGLCPPDISTHSPSVCCASKLIRKTSLKRATTTPISCQNIRSRKNGHFDFPLGSCRNSLIFQHRSEELCQNETNTADLLSSSRRIT